MFVMVIIDQDAENGRIRMRAKSQVVQDWESRRTLSRSWTVIMRKRRSARVRTLKRARDGLRGSSEESVTGYHRLDPQSRLTDHSTHLTLKWARFDRPLTRLSVIKKFTHEPIDVVFLVGEVGGGSVWKSHDLGHTAPTPTVTSRQITGRCRSKFHCCQSFLHDSVIFLPGWADRRC
jgi:hypothetical protein